MARAVARHGRILGLAAAALMAGCAEPPPEATDGRMVIPPLAVVSRTHLPPATAAAIDACAVTWDHIAGIGLVPRARDVPLYAPFSGREPELQSDRPAWVIQAKGRIQFVLAPGESLDPTCVVIDGVATVFDTGGAFTDQGVFVPPRERPVPPGVLPPLGP